MKCPTNIHLPCAFHSISSNVDATHALTNHKWYDPLHIITWPYWFIDLDFTCSSPLLRSVSTKSSLNLPFTLASSLSSLICNELLHHMCEPCNKSKPFHLHGMYCSHTCTYGLITCVSHINTISPSRVVNQLPKPHKDLSMASNYQGAVGITGLSVESDRPHLTRQVT